jgi:hypothetical protein
MSDIDRFAMPPRQVESPFVKKVDNHSRVDSVEMPPRSGGKLPSNRTSQYNSGNKFQQNGTGRQFNNNKSNSAMDIRNIPHMPVLHQSYGSYNTYPPRQHAGGPIRHERQQLTRGTPYNIPPPHQYPILHQTQHQPFNYQQQRPGLVTTNTNTNASRNVGKSNVVTNGRNLQPNNDIPIKISFSNDSLNTIEPSSAIQDRLDSLERTQQLLLKEFEALKKGLNNKDAEIDSLTHTIEDQKQKLKKEQATRSNNSQQNEDQYDYRITSSRNSYDEDDDAFDTNTKPITTGSINAMFARARNASNNKTL